MLLSLPFLFPQTSISFGAEEPIYDPVTVAEKKASAELSRRIYEALQLLDSARDLQAKGEFAQALDYFTQVTISNINSDTKTYK